MDNLFQDVRYGIRTLIRQPGFSLTAILTLALGIGATTAIFSVVNAVVLRPMPFADAERIVSVTNFYTNTGTQGSTVSSPDFFDWHEQNRSFDALAYYGNVETSVTVRAATDYAMVTRVTGDFFRVFGATAAFGRMWAADEEKPGGPETVLISDAYWRRQFGADPAAVGSTLSFEQRVYTIVGVIAAPFRYPARSDIYYLEQAPFSQFTVGAQQPRRRASRPGCDPGAGGK